MVGELEQIGEAIRGNGPVDAVQIIRKGRRAEELVICTDPKQAAQQ